ncbi:hypothetical protein [Lactobacillus intestinalis]|uniref:hypothetical protein n=1 Tax=Lactobacillus intestinalis TaxID=151781 RepID=UPI001F5648E3|nr:hypothetical protein [Lactobacillus intestinalis]
MTKSELLLYRAVIFLTMILILLLILVIQPSGIFAKAICWILAIGLFVIEIRLVIQVRKFKKNKKSSKNL